MYGCNPQVDLPFLWHLKHEINNATQYLLAQEENNEINTVLGNRSEASRLSYIIARKENELLNDILEDIHEAANLRPLCLLFNGAIVETKSNE